MLLKVPKDRLSSASRVGHVVDLDSISIVEGHFFTASKPESISTDSLVFEMKPTHFFDEKNKKISVRVNLGIKSKDAANSKSVRVGFEIRATFDLLYSLKVEPPPKDARDFFFESFASLSSLHHVWPYWREFVDSSIRRMGLPYFQTPLIQFKQEDVAPKEKPKKTIAKPPSKEKTARRSKDSSK